MFSRHVIRSSIGLRACEGKRSPLDEGKRSPLDEGKRSRVDDGNLSLADEGKLPLLDAEGASPLNGV